MTVRAGRLTAAAAGLTVLGWGLTAPVCGRTVLELMNNACPRIAAQQCPEGDAIAVLSGDGPPRVRVALRQSDTPSRSEAGLTLYHAGEAGYLLFTDGGIEGDQNRAAAILEGVPADRITVVTGALNTADEGRLIAKMAPAEHWRRVILVTSGYHMPRAKMMLEAEGRRARISLGVVEFPADSGKFSLLSKGWREFLPSAGRSEGSARAIRELLGQLVCRLNLC